MPQIVHKFETVHWLLEHGGANAADMTPNGQTIWDKLSIKLLNYKLLNYDPEILTALLRVIVLQSSPTTALMARLSPEHRTVVQEGARLRARLPAYLARRRALLDENCPLIGPLQALVIGYEEATTTEELWATGLGAGGREPTLLPPSCDSPSSCTCAEIQYYRTQN
jgi:hypothetical protein